MDYLEKLCSENGLSCYHLAAYELPATDGQVRQGKCLRCEQSIVLTDKYKDIGRTCGSGKVYLRVYEVAKGLNKTEHNAVESE